MNKVYATLVLFFIFSFLQGTSQVFSEAGVALPVLYQSSMSWGDYDNDGDLDLLLTGYNDSNCLTAIYKNQDGKLTVTNDHFQVVDRGIGLWADYDNDEELDVLITGQHWNENLYTQAWTNNRGYFTLQELGLQKLTDSCAAWADYDLDGDVDLALMGRVGTTHYAIIYQNRGGSLVNINAELTGVSEGALAWSDIDNDGDPDLLVTGKNQNGQLTKLYRNEKGKFKYLQTGLQNVGANSNVAWGDYDNDGDQDLLLAGYTGSLRITKLYRNDGAKFVDVNANLAPLGNPSLSWGDYDNDGFLDILMNGDDEYRTPTTALYHNNSYGGFVKQETSLANVMRGSASFVDYDQDGDLDICLSGQTKQGKLTKIYNNTLGEKYNWLGFILEGNRSCKDAVGARISIGSQTREINCNINTVNRIAHFGLGNISRVDSLTITWPASGIVTKLYGVNTNQYLRLQEGETLSKPFNEIAQETVIVKEPLVEVKATIEPELVTPSTVDSSNLSQIVFSDSFNDGIINSTLWTVTGYDVVEQNGVLNIKQNITDEGPIITSSDIALGTPETFTLSRKAKIYHTNEYSMPSMTLFLDDLPAFGIYYANMSYSSGNLHPCYGVYLGKNGSNPHVYNTPQPEASKAIKGIWDEWFDELIEYDFQSGMLNYYVSGVLKLSYMVGISSKTSAHTLKISMNSWCWWTGTVHYVDDLVLTVQGVHTNPALTEAFAAYESDDYQAAVEVLEASLIATPDQEPEFFWQIALNYIGLGDEHRATALLWLNKYVSSKDTAHMEEALRYISILEEQKDIFHSSRIEAIPVRSSTALSERSPVVSPDGQWLYYSAVNKGENLQTEIYRSPRINNQWGNPSIVTELCTSRDESLSSFSLDGTISWLSGKWDKSSSDFDIYISRLHDTVWQHPVPVNAVNSPSNDLDPCVYADKLIIFSSDRPGGYGNYDLYYSIFHEGFWSTPVNLGAEINTAFNETSPYIDWNGSNLYYSSDAPQGLGGSDIYRAVLISIESMSLSLPQNLGTPINSRHNEQRFVQMVGSTESLIISDRGKARRYGMFSVYTQESESRGYFIRKTPNSSQRVWINQTTDNRSGIPEITLKGQVTGQSGVDGEQILEISFKLAGVSRRVWTKLDRSGNYSINVPSADVYTIELSIPGYFRHYQDILRNPNETSLRHDIVMSKLDPRVTVILQNILFEYNSDVILPSSQTSLDNAVNTLLDNPDIRVEISGHTSSDGSDAYNLELSRKRAKAVEVYLIKRGVPADRLKSVGYGETKPLNDNSTEAFRKMNRRVEFRVL